MPPDRHGDTWLAGELAGSPHRLTPCSLGSMRLSTGGGLRPFLLLTGDLSLLTLFGSLRTDYIHSSVVRLRFSPSLLHRSVREISCATFGHDWRIVLVVTFQTEQQRKVIRCVLATWDHLSRTLGDAATNLVHESPRHLRLPKRTRDRFSLAGQDGAKRFLGLLLLFDSISISARWSAESAVARLFEKKKSSLTKRKSSINQQKAVTYIRSWYLFGTNKSLSCQAILYFRRFQI